MESIEGVLRSKQERICRIEREKGGLGAIAGVCLGGFITLIRLGIGAHLPRITTGVAAGALLASLMALLIFFHDARKNWDIEAAMVSNGAHRLEVIEHDLVELGILNE